MNNCRVAGSPLLAAAVLSSVLTICLPSTAAGQALGIPSISDAVRSVAESQFALRSFGSMLVAVLVDGEMVTTLALGEAMPGVSVGIDDHFRNGGVALTYVAALALQLADEGRIDLDAPIARWIPDLPGAEQASLRMLLNMTAGYPDHVAQEDQFIVPFYANPFRQWTSEDMIAISLGADRTFAPGDNWDYSHAGYVIAGRVLEQATGISLAQLMDDYIITPLGLTGTEGFDTPQVPPPVVHSYTGERGIWEDATFWNPSWTLPEGAVQTTTIADMAASFDAITGHDGFLSPQARAAMVGQSLVGFGTPLAGCPTCRTLTYQSGYGLGVVLQRDWVFQTPSFAGFSSSVATLPDGFSAAGRITIAVSGTFRQAAHSDWQGNLANWSDETVRLIGAELAPDNPPAIRPR